MLQYLENTSGKRPKYWQIDWNGTLLNTVYGKIGAKGRRSEKVCKDEIEAFKIYKNKILEKLKRGYVDPNGKLSEVDFQDTAYDAFLEQREFEKAVDWLAKFGELKDDAYENKLIKAFVENKQYAAAEKYIFGKIKDSKKATIIIRQIRYLSVVNPMMCRFMIGNLPAQPEAADMAAYYQNLAIAQATIGMIHAAATGLKNIESNRVKIIYLAHFLDANPETSEQQIGLLEKAISILETIPKGSEEKAALCLLLSKKAALIGQKETSERLLLIAK